MNGSDRPPGSRRRGVVREALAEWARQWASEGRPGGLTLPELAQLVPGVSVAAPSERAMLENTVRDMVRAGELVRLGLVNRPGQRGKPLRVYAPPALQGSGGPAEAIALLFSVAGMWGRSVPGDAAELADLVLPGTNGAVPGGDVPANGGNLHAVVEIGAACGPGAAESRFADSGAGSGETGANRLKSAEIG